MRTGRYRNILHKPLVLEPETPVAQSQTEVNNELITNILTKSNEG